MLQGRKHQGGQWLLATMSLGVSVDIYERITPLDMLFSGLTRLTTVNVKLASGRSETCRYLESASWRKIDMLSGCPLRPPELP